MYLCLCGILFRTRKSVAGFKWRHDIFLLHFERLLWLLTGRGRNRTRWELLGKFKLELVVI